MTRMVKQVWKHMQNPRVPISQANQSSCTAKSLEIQLHSAPGTPHMEQPFSRSVSSSRTKECTFRIKSASDFENGKWTCSPSLRGGNSKRSDPVDILVARPPESIGIQVSEVLRDANHEILQAQNPVNFTCEVEGIRPDVESIQWYIVREDGSEDPLTPSHTELLRNNKTFVSADFSSYPGMPNQGVQQMMVFNVNATFSHVISPQDNGRNLVCRVTHMLLHPANNSASTKLEVQYVPVVHMDAWKTKNFDPNGNKFYLPPGTKGEITVHFLANPPISAPEREVQWILRNSVTLNSGEEYGKVKAGPVTRAPSARDDLYETTLTIDPVGREDATDGYLLRLYSSSVSLNAQEPYTEFKFGVELADRPPATVGSIFYYHYKQKKVRNITLSKEETDRFLRGQPESLNPMMGLSEQAHLLPFEEHWHFPAEKLKLGKDPYPQSGGYVKKVDSIAIGEVLGSGAFGYVLKAVAVGICPPEPKTIVAVKRRKPLSSLENYQTHLMEVKIMSHLGMHLNVVNFLGVCTKDVAHGDLMMIVEYCPFGSLQKYLRANVSHFIDQRDHPIGTLTGNTWRQQHHTHDSEDAELKTEREGTHGSFQPTTPSRLNSEWVVKYVAVASPATDSGGTEDVLQKDSIASDSGILPYSSRSESDSKNAALKGNASHKSLEGSARSRQFTTSNLVSWAYQIAKGMEYLVSRKVVHRDLATRNILLAEENIVKISDFGLARDIYEGNQYAQKGGGPLPIKWMALESLTQDMVYTSKSDVWAYGVTLWEMFSLGKTPYPGMNGAELVRLLQTGYRMEAPRFADHHIYQIMTRCWDEDPKDRPTFSALSAWFGEMLHESERLHYVEKSEAFAKKNEEYFRTKTDYLKMMTIDPEDGYLAPLRKKYGDEDVSIAAENVKSENFQPNMDYLLNMRTRTKLDHVRARQEPQGQKENPMVYANLKDDAFYGNEEKRHRGPEHTENQYSEITVAVNTK
ncbi:unnamed protein product [Darwinula stevensoni]|uniref:receptor protein-tyrosine kinase n=1 Tax=Darwinula stevensoni TaxID=69355 RepID=A0A7R9A668_9CRUS|nr:unnamed protein product [Darwinula stevensoni]CAG0893546.1 unnamed protein product [Darwinula stevensoni]